jgi:hypothetical protein
MQPHLSLGLQHVLQSKKKKKTCAVCPRVTKIRITKFRSYQLFTMKRIPSAWLVIRNLLNEIQYVLTKPENRGSTRVTSPYALLWGAFFQNILLLFKQFCGVSVALCFVSGNKFDFNFFWAIFRTFGNITPNYNIALMESSASIYELSPGT